MNQARLITLAAIIIAGAAARLLPHPPNFTPVAAMALFAGAMMAPRLLAFVVPLGAMLLSDLVIGVGDGSHMPYVYGAFALTVLMGMAIRGRVGLGSVPLTALGASVLFFGLTNFGAWLGTGLYPQTAEGLWAAYVAGIPFFAHTLAGNLFFSALFFGGFALAERHQPALREGLSA